MPARILFSRSSSWATGFVGAVSIASDEARPGWTLSFRGGFDIVNIWGAEIVARSGDLWTVRAAPWNAAIAPGGSVGFGFQAATTGTVPDPAGFALAGEAPAAPPRPILSVSDTIATEAAGGFAVFVLTLSAASTEAVTVGYRTADGSARAGADYRALAGTVTFAPGETRKEIRIALADDTRIEANETFQLRLADTVGATLRRDAATATILDDDAPRIRVADAVVTEGQSGTVRMEFLVTFSRPADGAVTVAFATADGTAVAGGDYAARSGKLTFAAGETSKTVVVTVAGDRLVEADETMFLRLSAPTRGVVEDGEAVGTIRNDDLPRLSVADAAPVTEGHPGDALPVGVLSTQGNQILDATGAPVRLAAVNWFGMETASFAPHGLAQRNWKEMMSEMAGLGFNALRIPFSAQAILEGGMPTGIDPLLNPDLIGLSPIRILDAIVAQAGTLGMKVILDHHRSAAGDGPNRNGLWHEGRFTEDRWVSMWEELAARYKGNATVAAADLHNEPHDVAWADWAAAAERAGNAIHKVNPDWLILVEGVGDHNGSYYWWGGNLMGAADRPVVLNTPGKLVYSPHDYPATVYPQPWFSSPDFPQNLPAVFDKNWGYLWREGTAPVLVGEMGTRLEDPRDAAWLQKLVGYLSGDMDGDGKADRTETGPSFAWWSWNPNSGDTGGLLGDDWRTIQTRKLQAIDPILPDPAALPAVARFAITLSDPAPAAVTLAWRTVAGSATEADYVAATGTLRFDAGEREKWVEVAIRPDRLAEGPETFRLQVADVAGALVADGLGVATILDDDAVALRAASDWAW